MYSTRSLLAILFLFYLFAVSFATSQGPHPTVLELRHHARDVMARHRVSLGKRFDDARFTWYVPGENACGSVDSTDDWVVAMNSQQYDGGSHCYQMITISYGGTTVQAKVTDESPGCDYGALDLSEALFSHLAPTSEGVIYGEWSF